MNSDRKRLQSYNMALESEKKKVTRSINELGRRVTAADVSAKTGLPVLTVSQVLNQLASETGGHLAVSGSGDVLYSFSPGFANTYLTRGLRLFFENASESILRTAFFLLRISFGIMLIFSFAIIVMTFFVLFYAQKGGQGKKPQSFDAGDRFNSFLNYMILRDIFFYFGNPSRNPVKYDYDKPTVRRPEQSNFLFDCFSFLFGDGDPNEGLEEKRWQLIAKVIKQHDNVITAEQLAPYTGADPKNEDAVLPVLVRFGGKPQVTESGNIIYSFPSLAVTAGAERPEPAPSFLREFHWKFTEASEQDLKPVYFIAFLNFAGSWFLWFILHSSKAPSLTALFTTLVVYGTLFLLVPLLRYFALEILNKRIDQRNTRRADCAESLLEPDLNLKKKIAESREYRLRDNLITRSNIVYTTEKDHLEQNDQQERQFMPGEIIDAKPEETFDASPQNLD